jgi:hypothetical protein
MTTAPPRTRPSCVHATVICWVSTDGRRLLARAAIAVPTAVPTAPHWSTKPTSASGATAAGREMRIDAITPRTARRISGRPCARRKPPPGARERRDRRVRSHRSHDPLGRRQQDQRPRCARGLRAPPVRSPFRSPAERFDGLIGPMAPRFAVAGPFPTTRPHHATSWGWGRVVGNGPGQSLPMGPSTRGGGGRTEVPGPEGPGALLSRRRQKQTTESDGGDGGR